MNRRPISARNVLSFPADALKALVDLISEVSPGHARKLLPRLLKGANAVQELLVPARLLVYDLLGEERYAEYTRLERQALEGDGTALSRWIASLRNCRLLVRQPREGDWVNALMAGN